MVEPSKEQEKESAAVLRSCLDRLAKLESLSNDDKELLCDDVADHISSLPREPWVLDVLDRVIGKNQRRHRASIHVLASLSDVPGVETRVGALLLNSDPEVRNAAIWTVGEHGWTQFAPYLNEILLHDADDSCLGAAISTCGQLRAAVNLPVLLETAQRDLRQGSSNRLQLLSTLRRYATSDAEPYFLAIFNDDRPHKPWDSHKEHRVLAAWGLAAVSRNEAALRFLIQMLDDPFLRLPNGNDPGVSMRASQALCDLFGLPFEWGTTQPEEVEQRLREAGV